MNASLHTDLYKNGFPIACAVCFRQYGSYDVLVQHISLHHPLHSVSYPLDFASRPGSETEPVTHLKYRIRNERLPTFYDIFSTDQYAKDRIRNPCYPFTDYAELQWARWMNEQMNSPTIDKFLKVDWVSELSMSIMTTHANFYHILRFAAICPPSIRAAHCNHGSKPSRLVQSGKQQRSSSKVIHLLLISVNRR